MNSLLLNRHIFIYLMGEAIVLLMSILASFVAIYMIKEWDFNSTSYKQYRLIRFSWFVTTVAWFALIAKMFLLPYFVFTLDSLSDIVPGAMCGAGVISYNDIGLKLLWLKITVLFILYLWHTLNRKDLQKGNYPWLKVKMALFLFGFVFIILESINDWQFFNGIDIHQVLNCCATLYGLLEGMNPLPFSLTPILLITLFYLLYAVLFFAYLGRMVFIYILFASLFGYIAYYGVLYIFGHYIYASPTHNCPFCMLQKEYYYVGYLIWGLLIIGIFKGVSEGLISLFDTFEKRGLRFSLILITLFVLLCSGYVLVYYIENHTLLEDTPKSTMSMPM